MGDFAGLNIGVTALYAQRRALEVTGQNIANSATDGYSRQAVDLQANGGPVVPAMWSRSDGVGNGVSVNGVRRLTDQFLEARSVQELGSYSRLQARQGVLINAERVFGEPSDAGLQAQLSEVWAGFDDVANHPGDLAARNQLLQRASTLAASLNQAAGGLADLWKTSHEQLVTIVADTNTTAANIAQLNATIRTASQAGVAPNELMDQRDRLVTHLADLVGATARTHDDGSVDVFVGGSALVRGDDAQQLAVQGATELAAVPPGTITIGWVKDGYPATVSAGRAGGMLDALNTAVPGYRDKLDAVAGALSSSVNTQLASGWDLDGNPGVALFSGTTAATIAVALTDPRALAASSTAPDPVSGPSLDGGNALATAELASSATGADQVYRSFIVNLGVDVQSTNRRTEIQAAVYSQVDAARRSVAEVNLDEEATNMIAFQHAYEGAARYLTAVDEMLDTLINRTGLVGR